MILLYALAGVLVVLLGRFAWLLPKRWMFYASLGVIGLAVLGVFLRLEPAPREHSAFLVAVIVTSVFVRRGQPRFATITETRNPPR